MSTERSNDIDGFYHWADAQASSRKEREEYLKNPPPFSDLWIKRGLLQRALKPIAAKHKGDQIDILESKGANMEVYDFVEDDLAVLLEEWAALKGQSPDDNLKTRIRGFAKEVAHRFVFKVGNTNDFIVKFGPKTSVFPRDDMEEGFAPLGVLIKHTIRRVRNLARDVLRFNLYLGNEEKHPVTGPHLCGEMRRFLEEPDSFGALANSPDFMATDEGGEKWDVASVCSEIPGGDYNDYLKLNRTLRQPELEKNEGDLKPFFDAVVTIGLHDTMRRLARYDCHTTLDHDGASDLIKQVSQKHRESSYVLPEQTTYGYDPRLSSGEWAKIDQNNGEVATRLQFFLKEEASPALQPIFQNDYIAHEYCRAVLEHYNDIPEYEVDPATTFLSSTMLKFLFKAAYLYTVRPGCRKRKDFEKSAPLSGFFEKLSPGDVEALRKATLRALKNYGKIRPKGDVPSFIRQEKTQVKTQDRLDYHPEGKAVKGFPISIRRIINEQPELLKKYPEIAEKLLLLYYQIYKMMQDTGYIPDLRPENIIKYMFGMGEWAVQTENIQVTVFETPDGKRSVEVKNVDPEDHFRKSPEHEDDRHPQEGLAKYGLGLADVAARSIKKAISRFVEQVAKEQGIVGTKTIISRSAWAQQWIFDFMREGERRAQKISQVLITSVRSEIKNGLRRFKDRKK